MAAIFGEDPLMGAGGGGVRKTFLFLSVENIHFYLIFLFYPPEAGDIQIEGAAFLLLMSE